MPINRFFNRFCLAGLAVMAQIGYLRGRRFWPSEVTGQPEPNPPQIGNLSINFVFIFNLLGVEHFEALFLGFVP